MKKGSLFVLFELMRSTQQGCFKSHSWSLWKALKEKGFMGLVSWLKRAWFQVKKSHWICAHDLSFDDYFFSLHVRMK